MLETAIDRSSLRPRAIANWLLAVAVLVFAMVVVGGITRLTESGLSITEWKPVTGTIPPLTTAQWQAAFDAYKQIPEYQRLNQGMTLDQFQFIFFWEYIHRLLGRLIGVAFALPLAWFAIKSAIPQGYGWRLVALLALGGLQGAVGWWMVASGLSERTDVSHFRLAAHLLTALFILAGLVWTALDLRALARPARLTRLSVIVGIVLFVQLLFGAWTAGLNAGLVTSEWPLMNGRAFPSEVLATRPLLDAIANDPFLIHWIHRWWAWIAAAALVVLARHAKRSGDRRASIALHAAVGTQIVLGIATVWTGVNIPLAVLHQAVGALVVISSVAAAHSIGQIDRVSQYPSTSPQPA
jgi:heme a synthase